MGCNIHAVVEYREKKLRSEWNALRKDTDEDGRVTAHIERNYWLYAYLAGVRNYANLEPVVKPRGVSANVSPEYRALVDYHGTDGHTHSVLYLEELRRIPWDSTLGESSQTLKSYSAGFWRDIITPMEEKEAAGFHTRVVFFFDN